jgi:hypothetical protein
MRDFLKVGVRRPASGWFWALVLLVLPNCSFDVSGLGTVPNLTKGDMPHTSAIMCDIEKFQGPTRRCATPTDLAMGIPLANAAEALVTGQASNVGLDFSPAAQAACGTGIPQAIDFQGSFPDGLAVCLNCGVIPVPHADATAVCVAQCRDLIAEDTVGPAPPDPLAFCTANARPSTHFPTSGCFEDACSTAGTLRPDFADPRRIAEAVVWRDLIGTAAVGSTLTRTAPTSPPPDDLTAGAVSTQWITRGDAYVEFEAADITRTKIAGLSQVPGACVFPCTDSDPGITNLPFAISLNAFDKVFVVENGAVPPGGPDVDGSWGTYAIGERFRVRVTDNNDGTGTVTYSRIVGACVPGNPCNETVFHTAASAAVYPLRVDTSFREQNGTLANVSIVRIQ